ncbi:BICD family-like cargo adapter 2 isoform X3 [Entelurus aequoreus]|uniref:BICD family-like cargo adapter 2 isoform X3 n=1 Tax=Entelurus aequoreus TaxID=161455 RepID=UPI002B1DC4DA|nr:BICD family-like cargo adapter 2 isoform X3 [Entelurus aequoreus]
MFTPRKDSLPSPSLEDSFFPLSATSSISLSFALPASMMTNGGIDTGGGIETDLILAAELGQALLEKNEELAAALEEKEREVETLQQEKHVLQRRLEMNELASGQKEAELNGDLATLRTELDRHQCLGRDRRRDESEQLTQLANHNQRLVEQLSENRVLKERLAHMEAQLKASYEDSDRQRSERDVLRHRVSDLQVQLKEKEAEIEQEQGVVFELRTMNRSLQRNSLSLGEESILDIKHTPPLSLLSEIQQSQAKDALLAHSVALQARDDEITTMKEEIKSQQEELDLLREEIKPFRSNPGQPSYSFLENEFATVQQEKDLLNRQLLNTIQHKVALSQELDAWQEDMRLVINQQVLQKEEDRIKEMQRERMSTGGLQRSKSLKLKGESGKGFFSSLFRDK